MGLENTRFFFRRELREALLNFGHTIGHGIEASVPYGEMLHGEAISLGIRAALLISEKHAGLTADESAKVIGLLESYHLPLVLSPDITTDTVMEKLARDKKFSSGAIRFVVLDALGSAKVINTVTANGGLRFIGLSNSSTDRLMTFGATASASTTAA